VDRAIKDKFIVKLEASGGYILSETEKAKLEKVLSVQPGRINPKIVGKSAKYIADKAGLQIPEGTKVLIALETKIGKDAPYSLEKLSPIFALYVAEDSEDAKRISIELLNLG